MAKPLDKVEQDALALPAKDRAELARDLLATLDSGEDADVEEAWITEAERRYQEYRSGKVKLIPAEEALQRVRRDVRSRTELGGYLHRQTPPRSPRPQPHSVMRITE